MMNRVRAPLDVCRLLFAEAAARVAETFAIVRMREAIPVVRGSTIAAALAATLGGYGAAALCAIVIITLEQRALRNAREHGVRLLSWAVIAASLILVASAYLRVRYYEAAYGYTEERLCVQVICGLVSLALLSLALELRSAIDIPRLIRHVALIAIACVAGLTYWNHAAWIVDANIGRYERTGNVDVAYLERLARSSPDAIPALIDALPKLAPADASRVRESLRHAWVNGSVLVPPRATGSLSWYEWSLRRASARTVLRAAGLLDESAAR